MSLFRATPLPFLGAGGPTTAALAGQAQSAPQFKGSSSGTAAVQGRGKTQSSTKATIGGAAALAFAAKSNQPAKALISGAAGLAGALRGRARAAGALSAATALAGRAAALARGTLSSALTHALTAFGISAFPGRAGAAGTAGLVGKASTRFWGSLAPSTTRALIAVLRSAAILRGTASGSASLFGRARTASRLTATLRVMLFLSGSVHAKSNITGPIKGVAGLSGNILTLTKGSGSRQGIVSLGGIIRAAAGARGKIGQLIVNLVPIPRYIAELFYPPSYTTHWALQDLSYTTNTDMSNMPQASPLPPIDALRQAQTISLDFGSGGYLPDGVTLIGTPTVEISVLVGEDPSPQDRITAGPVIGVAPKPYGSGRANCTVLLQLSGAPSTAVRYLLECECAVSNGDTATMDAELPVRTPPN